MKSAEIRASGIEPVPVADWLVKATVFKVDSLETQERISSVRNRPTR